MNSDNLTPLLVNQWQVLRLHTELNNHYWFYCIINRTYDRLNMSYRSWSEDEPVGSCSSLYRPVSSLLDVFLLTSCPRSVCAQRPAPCGCPRSVPWATMTKHSAPSASSLPQDRVRVQLRNFSRKTNFISHDLFHTVPLIWSLVSMIYSIRPKKKKKKALTHFYQTETTQR